MQLNLQVLMRLGQARFEPAGFTRATARPHPGPQTPDPGPGEERRSGREREQGKVRGFRDPSRTGTVRKANRRPDPGPDPGGG